MQHTASAAIASIVTTCLASSVLAGGLVMNEYNAVGSTKWLNAGSATADITGGYASDLTFGRVIGNQNNWIELVVTQDHLDIRGWKLRWAENLKFTSNGSDLWYGDSMVNQGIITFSNDSRVPSFSVSLSNASMRLAVRPTASALAAKNQDRFFGAAVETASPRTLCNNVGFAAGSSRSIFASRVPAWFSVVESCARAP